MRTPSARDQGREYSYWGGLVGLAVVATLFVALPPLDSSLESHQGLHHLQHAVLFSFSLLAGRASFMLARVMASDSSGRLKWFSRAVLVAGHKTNPGGIPTLLLAAGLVSLWHIPQFFNLAVVDDTFHVLEHLSFLIAGGSVGFGLQQMGTWTRLGSLLIAEVAMLLFAAVIVVFQPHIYRVYPLEHEIVFGIAMVYAMMPIMLYTVYRFLVAQVS